MKQTTPRFWEIKTLSEMTREEWESLCDGCGRCCLEKLQELSTGKTRYTSVACELLDIETCRCTAYEQRLEKMPDCLSMTPENIRMFRWLPRTCAYRLILEGKPLPEWHPLISGNPDSVHDAGISVRGKVVSGRYVHPDDLENFIIDWNIWSRRAGTDS